MRSVATLIALLAQPLSAQAGQFGRGPIGVDRHKVEGLVATSTLILRGTVQSSQTAHWYGPSGDEVAELAVVAISEEFKGHVDSGTVGLWLEWPMDLEVGQVVLVFGGAKYSHLDTILPPPAFSATPNYSDLMIPTHQNTVWTPGHPTSAADGWGGRGYACRTESKGWQTSRTPVSQTRYCSTQSQVWLESEVRTLVEAGPELAGWSPGITLAGWSIEW